MPFPHFFYIMSNRFSFFKNDFFVMRTIFLKNEARNVEIMEISSTLAQTIVTDMKKIINQELNFIDTDGLVIASTDPKRINTFHEGAKKVISTKENLIIEDNGQFRGTKKGINIPIYFEKVIIGVIGITGEKDEVVKYGQIIRKMTEILIKEAWLKDLSIQRRENYRTLIDYILFSSDFVEGKANFSNMLKIDLLTPKDVVIGTIIPTKQSSANFIEGINSILEKFYPSNQQTIYSIKNDEIIMIIDHTSEQELEFTLQNIIKEASELLFTEIIVGIGLTTTDTISIKQSYNLAKSALSWSKIFSSQSIHYFKDLDLGMILNHTTSTDKKFYLDKVLANLPEEDIIKVSHILTVYGENNGSINKSADDLYIHKNTLQYQLNKIAKLTGYNPRNINDYVILKIAFLLHKTI
jgi:carbohydrate diacid regulator